MSVACLRISLSLPFPLPFPPYFYHWVFPEPSAHIAKLVRLASADDRGDMDNNRALPALIRRA
jgi:hypothetical protein